MENEKQIIMLDRGKQIGYSHMDGDILTECGIQKKDALYYVYFLEGDLQKDPFGDNGTLKEEYYSFTDIDKAIHYINSRGFNFIGFTPEKVKNIFILKIMSLFLCKKPKHLNMLRFFIMCTRYPQIQRSGIYKCPKLFLGDYGNSQFLGSLVLRGI